MTPFFKCFARIGLGFYHTGVEIDYGNKKREYSFGPNLFRKSGIAHCNPKEGVENADFKEQLHIGDTNYT
jgi:hypothetical protein